MNEFALKVESRRHKLRSKIESFAKNLHWIGDINSIGAAAKSGISTFFEIPVEKLKEETNQILLDEDIHIVIIIDDIDRLAPSEMLEVFQLIKLNANFNNTLFLISFDKNIVSQSIRNSYQVDGNDYLEKIIQVDYSLPSIPLEELESMFFSRLKQLLGEESPFDASSLHAPWLMYGLRFYFNNIRDLNRYFNSISFRLPAIHREVNLHDFILIEAVRLFDFDSYEIIRDNYKEHIQFGDHSHFKNSLDSIPTGRTKQMYDYLFGPHSKSNPLSNNDFRIHDTEFFDRYFTLSISRKDVREEEFNNFIHYPPTRSNLLASVIRNNKIDFLLRRLVAKAGDFKNTDLMSAISPLLSIWGDFKEEFVEHWRTVWSAIKAIIKTTQDHNAGYRKLLDEISVSTSDFSPARFTFHWLVLQNIYQEDDKNIDPDLKPQNELFNANREKLERNFKHLLENYQTHFFFSSSYNELYQRIFFQSYARLLPDKYTEQFKQIASDDQRVFTIIDKLVFKDTETRKPVGINHSLSKMLIPENLELELFDKLRAIRSETLSKENSETLKYFLANFRRSA